MTVPCFPVVRGGIIALATWLAASESAGQDAWSRVTSPTERNLWSVAWGGGQFVAVGEGGVIVTSPDGQSWTSRAGAGTSWLVGSGYGEGTFVVVGEAGTILTSPDGVTWTSQTSGTTARINGVAFGGGRWLAVGESGEVLTSTDARAWTRLQPSRDRLHGVAYAYGQFVVTGDNGLMRTTVDTATFDEKALPGGFFVESVVNARRQFVAVGEAGYAVSSPDAVNWSQVAMGSPAHFRGVAYFNGYFVAAGSEGTIMATPAPGQPWSARDTGTRELLTAVAASEEAAVVVGFQGTILRSARTLSPPAIVSPPRSVTDVVGSNVLFKTTAVGAAPLSYQWLFNGAVLPGQTEDRLLLLNVQAAQAGSYAVRVANARGEVTSASAVFALQASNASTPVVDAAFAPAATFGGEIAAVVEQPDGRLLVGGASVFATPGVSPFPLVRLNVDGSIDATFNTGSGFSGGASVSALALDPDGGILVGGSFTTFDGVPRANVLRLRANGNLDTTFDATGIPVSPSRISVCPDGKILVQGQGTLRVLSARGAPLSFGPDAGWTRFEVRAHRVLSDGRIMLLQFDPAPGRGLFLHRLQADGSDDRSFLDHWLTTGLWSDYRLIGAQADGRFLLCAAWTTGRISGETVTRINPDGSVDTTWPGLKAPVGSFPRSTYALDAEGRILRGSIAPVSVNGSPQNRYVVERFTAQGQRDLSLDSLGGANAAIRGLVPLRDGRIAAYGDFTSFDGVARSRLVRLVAENAPAVQPPEIVAVSPEAIAVRAGEPLEVEILAAGSRPLTVVSTFGTAEIGPDGRIRATVPTGVSGTYAVSVSVSNRAGSVTTVPIRVVVAPSPPLFVAQPEPVVLARPGRAATLAVSVAGTAPFSYEWLRNGVRVGTDAALTLERVTAADEGEYVVVVRNSLGAATSRTIRLTLDRAARLANISTRSETGVGERALIAGFVIGGTGRKTMLIRGAGPALTLLSVPGALMNPMITLFDAGGRAIASNDNWDGSSAMRTNFAAVGAFPFAAGSADAALRTELAAGNYTLHLTGPDASTGIALVELYEDDGTPARLLNLSSRTRIESDEEVAISGFVVQGEQPGRFLIRAVGPGLADFNVGDALGDPRLTLTTALGAVLDANDDWGSAANASDIARNAAAVGAFPLGQGSRDAALLVSLAPGNYTALVRGASGTTGAVLIEIYEVR